MSEILKHFRRRRRRSRIPHGLLVSVSMMLLAVVLMSVLFALPASAKMKDFRMPRTENGVVTDSDGIIDSDGIASDIPDASDLIPDATDLIPDGSAATEGPNGGSDALDPTVTSEGETSSLGTTAENTTAAGTTTANTTAGDGIMGMDTRGWVIAIVILALVVLVIVILVWWATGTKRRD